MNEKATLIYNPEDVTLLELALRLREVFKPDFKIDCDTSKREPEVIVESEPFTVGPGCWPREFRFVGKEKIERLVRSVEVSVIPHPDPGQYRSVEDSTHLNHPQ